MAMFRLTIKARMQCCIVGVLLLAAGGFVGGCGDRGAPLAAEAAEDESAISFALRLSKPAQGILARVEVVITAADMATMVQELTISGELVSGMVTGIPTGNARLFTLNGYDDAGKMVYQGTAQADLQAGQVVALRIAMHRVEDPSIPSGELAVELPGGVRMDFVWIEPGRFIMGSPATEPERTSNEGPQHEVTITQGFYLGKYEVTQRQWEGVMGSNPSALTGPERPVEQVSWVDVQGFIDRLNRAAGETLYRLPTEAEWEYACRAETTTRWSFGDDQRQLGNHAWYKGNDDPAGTKEVGQKRSNPWGLYDMHGNVWEWVQDWYAAYTIHPKVDPAGPASGNNRVIRGGSFGEEIRFTRSARRHYKAPGARDPLLGVRLVRVAR